MAQLKFMACFVTMLISQSAYCFVPSGIESGLFYGPTSNTISWHPIQPKEIICRQRILPELAPSTTEKIPARKLTYTDSHSVPGYLCSKSRWDVICTENFLGGRTLTHQLHPSLPSEIECVEAVKIFRTSHNLDLGFPPEDCGWWSTNTASQTQVHVTESTVEMDPYSLILLDPRFATGSCKIPPCQLSTMDTIWMNRTDLKKSCPKNQLIDVYKFNSSSPDFYSPDLIGSTLSGSCQMMVCGGKGLRLITGEWIGLEARNTREQEWYSNYPKCSDHVSVNDISLTGIISHLNKISLIDEQYRLCVNTKEKILSGEPISRTDLGSIAHSAPTPGPVYRLNNDNLEVGLSDYQTLESVDPVKEGLDLDVIGRTVATQVLVKWNYWVDHTTSLREGPNGMISVSGYLVNPMISLDTPGLYRDKLMTDHNLSLQHPIVSSGAVGHALDWVFNPKSTSASLTHVLPRSFHWFSFSFIGTCLLIIICVLLGGYIISKLIQVYQCFTAKKTHSDKLLVGYTPSHMRI
nr:putative glycoprotein [Hattula rhabdovirus]